jgi:hypothetical protein
MVLTFYVGEAATAFKQYAVYMQRRTATYLAQFGAAPTISVARRSIHFADGG